MRKRGTGCLFLFPLRHEVEGDGGQDDEALDRLLPVGGNAHHGHTVIEDTDDEENESYASVDDESVLNAVFDIFKDKFKDEFNFVD